ncbi:MAG TPA: ATP-binding protein, partial [Mycobacterium sp.]|nr:ATP-binding protein [Mycobacterium sp.]
ARHTADLPLEHRCGTVNVEGTANMNPGVPPQVRHVKAGAAPQRTVGPFEQWGRFLPEHTTAASILDRLLHHADVIATNGTQTVLA